ncbi:MAG: MGMT family protein [Thermoproteota archaeon]
MGKKQHKSWQEKLMDDKGLPKVVKITGKMSRRLGTGTVVIPASREVDEIMRKVPKGNVITINRIREILAKRHGTTIGCPIATGIFAWVATNAAEEEAKEGEKDITPYWRTLKSNGELNAKYPGGVARQARLLKAEGLTIEAGKGSKPPRVKDFEEHLADLK